MDPVVTAAVVAAAASAVGWAVNYVVSAVTDRNHAREVARQSHAQKQLELLYGPLAFLIYEGRQTFNDLMKQAGEGSFLWQDREPTDEELPLWRFWIDHDFMPRNAVIKDLLAKNTHLVVGKELPDSYIRFLDHANSWEMDYKRWKEGEGSVLPDSWRARTGWPQSFETEILATFQRLMGEHEELTGAVGRPTRLYRMRQRVVRVHVKPWSVTEAFSFLESASIDYDPLCVAYVLMLVLGLRSDEVRELLWSNVWPETPDWSKVDPDRAEFNKGLLIRWTKRRFVGDEAQTALLPLPSLCLIALKFQNKQQKDWQDKKVNEWHPTRRESRPIFTTRSGLLFEARNFNQQFTERCRKAGVRCIEPQVLRQTCASLLAALDVAPSRCPFTGVVHWRQLMAGSGGSQGFPAMVLLMASSAVMP